MGISSSFKNYIKTTPLVSPYIWLKNINSRTNSQSNEAQIIDRLVAELNVPKAFIEFGFSGWEFNCINLARSPEWKGLLADGSAYNVTVAKKIFHKQIMAQKLWITLDTLDLILDYAESKEIGILSIDVDGNDYWFLEKLISINPALIITEFNVSFGSRPISVPYDAAFDRTKKHESNEYYGASLSAFNHLCALHNYSLVEMSSNGVNAFFVRNGLVDDARKLTPGERRLVKRYPDGSVAPTLQSWKEIKHLPYVDVTKPDANYKATGAPLFARETSEQAASRADSKL